MKLAVLFWCYKNLEICKDRVRHIRRNNPEVQIFVLFGGNPNEADDYAEALKPDVDDFYIFDDPPPPGAEEIAAEFRGGLHWKYLYGDLQISAWYRNRGKSLQWDTVVLLQWDMLIFGKVSEVFKCLKKDEILLSGLRPVKEVEKEWSWVAKSQPEARTMYLEFMRYVEEKFGFIEEPLCCLAIVLGLPRRYLEQYAQIARPELGFIEYRLPVYAQIFGTPFCTRHSFKPWWPAVERYKFGTTLRARLSEISVSSILFNLLRPNGARVFHPYWGTVLKGPLYWIGQLKRRSRKEYGKKRATALNAPGFPESQSEKQHSFTESLES